MHRTQSVKLRASNRTLHWCTHRLLVVQSGVEYILVELEIAKLTQRKHQ